MPARPEELQRLLGASRDDNRHLTAQVLRLEAELGELRGELRGAVHDALTDPLTGLANRRAFDLELGAVPPADRLRGLPSGPQRHCRATDRG
jgi:GGDEF domain-containing protein